MTTDHAEAAPGATAAWAAAIAAEADRLPRLLWVLAEAVYLARAFRHDGITVLDHGGHGDRRTTAIEAAAAVVEAEAGVGVAVSSGSSRTTSWRLRRHWPVGCVFLRLHPESGEMGLEPLWRPAADLLPRVMVSIQTGGDGEGGGIEPDAVARSFNQRSDRKLVPAAWRSRDPALGERPTSGRAAALERGFVLHVSDHVHTNVAVFDPERNARLLATRGRARRGPSK